MHFGIVRNKLRPGALRDDGENWGEWLATERDADVAGFAGPHVTLGHFQIKNIWGEQVKLLAELAHNVTVIFLIRN